MAAEHLSALGYAVTIYEQMPTVGRKFLLAGKSGLNLTHSESFPQFLKRYGESANYILPALEQFNADHLRRWADVLGAETFIGSSGRIFPKAMKASPLLRAWIKRLETQGVRFLTRHRWMGFENKKPIVETPDGAKIVDCNAALLTFGGASWPRLGSDGLWVDTLQHKDIAVSPLKPANCGFDVDWSQHIRSNFDGAPVKSVTVTSKLGTTSGEFIISRTGVEGGLIYTHSAALRDDLEKLGQAKLILDLVPGKSLQRLEEDLLRQKSKTSFSNLLRKGAGLNNVKAALVFEYGKTTDRRELAQAIKALSIPLVTPRPIDEAISTAGGVSWQELDTGYMLKKMPGTFVAGEMIDWEAPTGGYLLSACFAMGVAAGKGIDGWLRRTQ